MPALLLTEDLAISHGERDVPEPPEGEVRVDVELAGLCGSDLHVLRTGAWVRYWPATLGHEVVGIVATEAPGAPALGTRVVVDSRLPDRSCDACERDARWCEQITWLGESRPGGFAGAFNVPIDMLVPVPDGVAPELAVLAEPLAVASAALDQVRRAPRRAVVLGYGPVGALVAADLRRRWPEANLVVVEVGQWRSDHARDQGFEVVPSVAYAEERIDLVVDAAGYPGSTAEALGLLGRGGELVIVALGEGAIEAPAAVFVESGLSISGSIGFGDDGLAAALTHLAEHPEAYGHILTHRLPLTEAPEFLARSGHRSALKVAWEVTK
ncbi:zinc-dependent alcohol dehydrogenase [Brachybacterium sp. AOP42-C2-15]|uniref:zinc-dependent alcohol dehydrogenase n=1 Tax=Brachybacterium sp. AOP42-C2-15 TaxID=3457670 RepID=UPI004033CF68